MTDIEYMRYALELARKGCGWVNPNPMVGAVIVKDGEIMGEGFHEKYGQYHAERNALNSCNQSAKGATLYVTLEPCCHYGKTPPCTEAIIENGISRVVIGSSDPNPLVAGNGIRLLQNHGIEVVAGVLKEECDSLNEVFFHFIKTRTPYVVMKYAMTMDGKIATNTGKSKWITGEAARQRVHEDRHRYSAIMVGIGTILSDDPMLTCRLQNRKNPVRIICDTHLRTPITSNVVATAFQAKTVICTACTDSKKHKAYLDEGCEIITLPIKNGHIDLNILMTELGKKNIDSILLEGGSTLNWSALESGIVNKVQAYIAPKLFGGNDSKSPIGGAGLDDPKDAFRLINPKVTCYDDDILIESEVLTCLQE